MIFNKYRILLLLSLFLFLGCSKLYTTSANSKMIKGKSIKIGEMLIWTESSINNNDFSLYENNKGIYLIQRINEKNLYRLSGVTLNFQDYSRDLVSLLKKYKLKVLISVRNRYVSKKHHTYVEFNRKGKDTLFTYIVDINGTKAQEVLQEIEAYNKGEKEKKLISQKEAYHKKMIKKNIKKVVQAYHFDKYISDDNFLEWKWKPKKIWEINNTNHMLNGEGILISSANRKLSKNSLFHVKHDDSIIYTIKLKLTFKDNIVVSDDITVEILGDLIFPNKFSQKTDSKYLDIVSNSTFPKNVFQLMHKASLDLEERYITVKKKIAIEKEKITQEVARQREAREKEKARYNKSIDDWEYYHNMRRGL